MSNHEKVWSMNHWQSKISQLLRIAYFAQSLSQFRFLTSPLNGKLRFAFSFFSDNFRKVTDWLRSSCFILVQLFQTCSRALLQMSAKIFMSFLLTTTFVFDFCCNEDFSGPFHLFHPIDSNKCWVFSSISPHPSLLWRKFFPKQLHWQNLDFHTIIQLFSRLWVMLTCGMIVYVIEMSAQYYYEEMITHSNYSFRKLWLSSLQIGGWGIICWVRYWKRPFHVQDYKKPRTAEVDAQTGRIKTLNGWFFASLKKCSKSGFFPETFVNSFLCQRTLLFLIVQKLLSGKLLSIPHQHSVPNSFGYQFILF